MQHGEETSAAAVEKPAAPTDAHRPRVCWLFTGLGVYRAWIEICFVGSFVDYPAGYSSLRSAFDLICVVALFACAAFSARLAPLFQRGSLSVAASLLCTFAAALGFASFWVPALATTAIATVGALAGGLGLAVIILLWSELYGCLNPVRIALYYALSQLVGAAVIWTCKGLALPWLAFYTCLLPLISLAMLRGGWGAVAPERQPRPSRARFSFPVKPVALVCAYAFAFGLEEANTYTVSGPHSGPGMVLVALVVVVAILGLQRRVEFGTVYSLWLPTLMMVSLAVGLLGSSSTVLAPLFMGVSYGAAEIFIMTMIGSICYRYGVNAIWIFGIERAVRMLAMMAGRLVAGPLADVAPGWLVSALVIAAAAVGTGLILSERGLSADWGVVLYEEGDNLNRIARTNALAKHCAELGRECGLTQREGEVLLLLAQRKTASDIEHELCVAHGTAKAHIRHVYKKLGIHARDELFALVEGGERGGAPKDE